ncbi:MAG: hypothetical protein V3V33_06285 [Candidatus Lokiarchaeia archaeon]
MTEKKIILKFYMPFIFLASIFMGPILNFIMFFDRKILNTYWSFFITQAKFTDLMALTFILFTVIFFFSNYFSEKIACKPAIIISNIFIGYNCIYAGFSWTWELYFLTFVLIGATLGFLIPMIFKLIRNSINMERRNIYHKLVFPISILVWILIEIIVFTLLGRYSWKMLYIVIGIIAIAISPLTLIVKTS